MSGEGEIDHRSFRHWGGFIFSGLSAFVVDLIVAEALHAGLGVEANVANLFGILAATVAAYFLHRRISFNVQAPPSLREFVTFFVFASGANSISFLSNALFLYLFPIVHFDELVIAIVMWAFDALHLDAVVARPVLSNFEVAFFSSRLVGGALSYIGFRFGVFRRPRLKADAV